MYSYLACKQGTQREGWTSLSVLPPCKLLAAPLTLMNGTTPWQSDCACPFGPAVCSCLACRMRTCTSVLQYRGPWTHPKCCKPNFCMCGVVEDKSEKQAILAVFISVSCVVGQFKQLTKAYTAETYSFSDISIASYCISCTQKVPVSSNKYVTEAVTEAVQT